MKKFMLLCLSIFVLGGTFPSVYAQFHGNLFVGDNQSQSGAAIAIRPLSNPIVLGSTTISPGLFRSRAISYPDNGNLGNFNVIRYDFGGNNTRILAAANSSSNSLVGVAGTCRIGGDVADDAFFADVAENVSSDAQQMVLVSNPGTDRATKVIELQDNSFVVVGSNTNGTVGTSWVMRLGNRPNYDLKFYLTLGNLTGPSSGGEGANGVVQAVDGSILVAGTTFQSSSNAQGSVYIARISTLGVLQEYHTYTIGGGVLAPRVTDMARLNNGSLVLVGNTNIPNDADHYGFIMQVSSDLATATFQEVLQPGVNTFGQEFNAVTVLQNTDTYFIAGMTQRLLSGAINEDGLIIKVLPVGGPQIAKANDVNNGQEQFLDIVVRRDLTTVEAVGTASLLPSGISGPGGNNIFTQQTNLNLDACVERGVSLEFNIRPVTHATPVPVTSTSNPTRSATLTLSEVSMEQKLGCQSAPRLANPHDPTDAQFLPQLITDPLRSVATLHLGKHATHAQVSLSDPKGRLIRQWILSDPDLEIALDDLPAGLYLVSVLHGTHPSTLKLSVQ